MLLVRLFVRYSYAIISVILSLVLTFVLARDGIQVFDAILISGTPLVFFGLWLNIRPSQTEMIEEPSALEQALNNGDRPTIIEFFSTYCTGCIAMKPIMERLEEEAQDRLQIIRLNIDHEPGRSLITEYNVKFTPTFVYFDASGKKLHETVGYMDKARILHELEQAS